MIYVHCIIERQEGKHPGMGGWNTTLLNKAGPTPTYIWKADNCVCVICNHDEYLNTVLRRIREERQTVIPPSRLLLQ
jgi:hypothetical protein